MFLDFTPAQQSFRQSIEQFAREVVAPRAAAVRRVLKGRSALVVVDMQRGLMGWSKLPGELGRTHAERTREVVLPSLVKLIKFFREKKLPIVYLTLGKEEILSEIAPSAERLREGKEFVLAKYSCSPQ